MIKTTILLCLALTAAREFLEFKVTSHDDCYILDLPKSKFGETEEGEDSVAVTPEVMAVADGVSGALFTSKPLSQILVATVAGDSLSENSPLSQITTVYGFREHIRSLALQAMSPLKERVASAYSNTMGEFVDEAQNILRPIDMETGSTLTVVNIRNTVKGSYLRGFIKGDCRVAVFRLQPRPDRQGSFYNLLFLSRELQRKFNFPYQFVTMLDDPENTRDDAIFEKPLRAGDIVIVASDGLFDNLSMPIVAFLVNLLVLFPELLNEESAHVLNEITEQVLQIVELEEQKIQEVIQETQAEEEVPAWSEPSSLEWELMEILGSESVEEEAGSPQKHDLPDRPLRKGLSQAPQSIRVKNPQLSKRAVTSPGFYPKEETGKMEHSQGQSTAASSLAIGGGLPGVRSRFQSEYSSSKAREASPNAKWASPAAIFRSKIEPNMFGFRKITPQPNKILTPKPGELPSIREFSFETKKSDFGQVARPLLRTEPSLPRPGTATPSQPSSINLASPSRPKLLSSKSIQEGSTWAKTVESLRTPEYVNKRDQIIEESLGSPARLMRKPGQGGKTSGIEILGTSPRRFLSRTPTFVRQREQKKRETQSKEAVRVDIRPHTVSSPTSRLNSHHGSAEKLRLAEAVGETERPSRKKIVKEFFKLDILDLLDMRRLRQKRNKKTGDSERRLDFPLVEFLGKTFAFSDRHLSEYGNRHSARQFSKRLVDAAKVIASKRSFYPSPFFLNSLLDSESQGEQSENGDMDVSPKDDDISAAVGLVVDAEKTPVEYNWEDQRWDLERLSARILREAKESTAVAVRNFMRQKQLEEAKCYLRPMEERLRDLDSRSKRSPLLESLIENKGQLI